HRSARGGRRTGAVRARPDRAGPGRGGGLRHHRRCPSATARASRDPLRARGAERGRPRGLGTGALRRRWCPMSAADPDPLPVPPLEAIRTELRRTNFSGRTVTLAEGALVVAGTSVLSLRTGRATDTAVLAGIGALGLLDDLLEPHMRRAGRPVSKGLR